MKAPTDPIDYKKVIFRIPIPEILHIIIVNEMIETCKKIKMRPSRAIYQSVGKNLITSIINDWLEENDC